VNILFVENHARFARIVTQQFLSAHAVTRVTSLAAAREILNSAIFDVVLLDYDLDDGKGDVLAGADAVCGKLQFSGIARVLNLISKKI
jgi:DNA-binding response OmpR family regulator